MHEGEVVPIERVRTRSKAIDRMYEMLKDHLPARQLAVLYTTDTNEADKLMSHVKQSHPQQQIYLARFGPVLGTYMGPGGFAVITLN